MRTDRPKLSRTEVVLIAAYLGIALARQVAHDLRTLSRWARAAA